MMNFIFNWLKWIIGLSLFPVVKRSAKILEITPLCPRDGEQVEFINETSSLFGSDLIYQCSICKEIFIVNSKKAESSIGDYIRYLSVK